ncbi:uncharacterized protein C16orf86 homolog isoform X2 [Phascolarctos cinereus]|uniref:Uncharacterized protein C16orf86 homolog isoform X2 n=1 Tax=Phascolarctos cinereus TaxID=38626 RepID=A0A6P5KKM7_PHACI|nr:uncharacterized protein C16orf86 homolog isoform X2 [Phascolarctos cinereus]
MAMAGLGRRPGHQAGSAQLGEAPESPGSPGAEGEEHQAGSGLEPEPEPELEPEPEPEPELEEGLAKDEEQLEPRGPRPRPPVLPLRASQGLKRKPAKVEAELQLQHTDLRRPPLRKEDSDGAQGEPSPTAKQHKKAKKRKSLGVPPPLATAAVVPTPAEALGLERKAQRLRPLYQYINYSNPELNQAGEGEAEVEVELGVVPDEASGGPEEAGVEKPQTSPLGEEGGEEPVPILSFTPGSQLKAEVDKSTQVDIAKMLSVCAAHLVPPLSPQYK